MTISCQSNNNENMEHTAGTLSDACGFVLGVWAQRVTPAVEERKQRDSPSLPPALLLVPQDHGQIDH